MTKKEQMARDLDEAKMNGFWIAHERVGWFVGWGTGTSMKRLSAFMSKSSAKVEMIRWSKARLAPDAQGPALAPKY